MHEKPAAFFLVPNRFKTQIMCNDAIDVYPWSLYDVADYFKTQKSVSMWSRGTLILYSLSLIGLLLRNN